MTGGATVSTWKGEAEIDKKTNMLQYITVGMLRPLSEMVLEWLHLDVQYVVQPDVIAVEKGEVQLENTSKMRPEYSDKTPVVSLLLTWDKIHC